MIGRINLLIQIGWYQDYLHHHHYFSFLISIIIFLLLHYQMSIFTIISFSSLQISDEHEFLSMTIVTSDNELLLKFRQRCPWKSTRWTNSKVICKLDFLAKVDKVSLTVSVTFLCQKVKRFWQPHRQRKGTMEKVN